MSGWIYIGLQFFVFMLFPLIIFIYCYGRMLVVIRRQMKVMAGHSAPGSTQMNASQSVWAVKLLPVGLCPLPFDPKWRPGPT